MTAITSRFSCASPTSICDLHAADCHYQYRKHPIMSTFAIDRSSLSPPRERKTSQSHLLLFQLSEKLISGNRRNRGNHGRPCWMLILRAISSTAARTTCESARNGWTYRRWICTVPVPGFASHDPRPSATWFTRASALFSRIIGFCCPCGSHLSRDVARRTCAKCQSTRHNSFGTQPCTQKLTSRRALVCGSDNWQPRDGA